MSQTENSKRIAKNTLLLYFRMMLTMGISLFTVRVVLKVLGDIDYGLFNVIGGIVIMFSFLSGTMASASQRFFSFELGRKNHERLKKTFSVTMAVYGMVAILVLILAETVGLWFLNTQMTIPADRMEAANWVFQFSIFSFLLTIFGVPYTAAIIAHEKMNIYAYVSIVEVGLKLLIVYLLVFFSFDKLKLYSILMFGVTLLTTLIYSLFSRRSFSECRSGFYWDTALFKEIIGYSGWNIFGALAGIFNNQGINIMLNIFFGPVVNTSRAIASQVNNAINQFVLNFLTAAQPQITKYYATGEHKEMTDLVFKISRYSYLLLFILSMPVLLETNFILGVWLKSVPEYLIIFVRLIVIISLIDSLSFPLMTAAQATGKIKWYQIVVGGAMLMVLPISYVFLRLNFPPQTVLYIGIANSLICLFLRLLLLKKMIGLSIPRFARQVLGVVFIVSVCSYIVPLLMVFQFDENFVRFFLIVVIGIICSSVAIYKLGLTTEEKHFAIATTQKLRRKYFN